MSNRSAFSWVPITAARRPARRNPVSRDTTVPRAIQALALATFWSVIIGQSLGDDTCAVAVEPAEQCDEHEHAGEPHGHPQHRPDLAGPDFEGFRGIADRLAVGRGQACGEERGVLVL